jgi:hypothetical protein
MVDRLFIAAANRAPGLARAASVVVTTKTGTTTTA